MILAAAFQLAAACTLTPDLERELRALKTERWPAIYATPDAAALEAFLHPKFQVIDAAGGVSTKAEEVEFVRAKRADPPGRRFTYTIERLDVFANCTAVISGRGRIELPRPGRPPQVMIYRSSNVLVLEDGAWRPILSHLSGDAVETP